MPVSAPETMGSPAERIPEYLCIGSRHDAERSKNSFMSRSQMSHGTKLNLLVRARTAHCVLTMGSAEKICPTGSKNGMEFLAWKPINARDMTYEKDSALTLLP